MGSCLADFLVAVFQASYADGNWGLGTMEEVLPQGQRFGDVRQHLS